MNPTTKIAATFFGGILLAIAAVFFGFRPLLSDVRAMNASLGQKQNELAKIQKQIIEFKSAQSDLAKATFKDDVYGTIVAREDLSLAIQDMETAALNTGTTETIQIAEVDSAGPAGETVASANIFKGLALSEEVPYSMTVQNDYVGLVNYLQYLEHLPHFTEFTKISLNAVPETQTTNQQTGAVHNSGAVNGSLQGVFLVKKNAPQK